MALLQISIDRVELGLEGTETAFATLIPLGDVGRERRHVMVPVGNRRKSEALDLETGDWLVEARLPSGECLRDQFTLERDMVFTLEAMPLIDESPADGDRVLTDALRYQRPEAFGTRRTTPTISARDDGDRKPTPALRLQGPPHAIAPPTSDWSKVGGRLRGSKVEIPANAWPFSIGHRAFAVAADCPYAVSLPLPWGEPMDQGDEIKIQVRVVAEPRGKSGNLTLKAWIRDPNVAPVLDFLEADDLQAVGESVGPLAKWAEDMLNRKFANPLGAALGALTLVRLREQELLHDWPLNLAQRFSWLPDGAAIAAWCILSFGMGAPANEPSDSRLVRSLGYVRQALQRGLPYFSQSVSLLRHASLAMRSSEGQSLTRFEVDRIEQWFKSVRSDSFIAVYERELLDVPPTDQPQIPKTDAHP